MILFPPLLLVCASSSLSLTGLLLLSMYSVYARVFILVGGVTVYIVGVGTSVVVCVVSVGGGVCIVGVHNAIFAVVVVCCVGYYVAVVDNVVACVAFNIIVVC